jgi:DNA-binding NarL/FixJ family response regulator
MVRESTTALVRSHAPARVRVLTRYGIDQYVYDALAAGASGFLVKTDYPARIAATIRAISSGEFAMGTETTRALVEKSLIGPRPADEDPLTTLTPREREVLQLVAEGMSNAEIAEAPVVGEGSGKSHVARILMKLELRDRVQVVVFAHRHRLIGA